MTRKNWRVSARSGAREAPSTAVAEPLTALSGVRSSWLTMDRNSARWRSSSSSGARSCSVTTIDSTAPSAERIGVALTSVVTRRPSGTDSVISSARTVSALLICCAIGNSARGTSRPSPRRQVTTPSSSSSAFSGMRSGSTIRRASRLNDTSLPLPPSKTTTPTGQVSTRASRSALARRSAWCVRALAMAVAACDANSTRTSSSAPVNSGPPSFSPRKKLPTCTSRWRIGVHCIVFETISSVGKPSSRT